MDDEYERVRQMLVGYGQEHLLQFYDVLHEIQKKALLRAIQMIDFETVLANFRASIQNAEKEKLYDQIRPLPKSLYCDAAKTPAEKLKHYEQRGLKLISESKVAVLVLAGGPGTRLGVSCPKGMFDIGLLSHKSLFQIQAERILRLQKLAYEQTGQRGEIPWLVLTSECTNTQTRAFFKKHNYFGLNSRNVYIFEQFVLPALTADGKLILADRHKISMTPDGNGGVYQALRDSTLLNQLEARSIEYVHAYSIDNILVKVGDPHFVGYCASFSVDTGVKVVEKTEPSEAIGVLCLVNEKWKVVEYSEISPELAERRAADGSLLFKAGNICNHVFSTEFLRKIANNYIDQLEFHIAHKKITTVDSRGELVRPSQPNGLKMEKFIFDVLPFADKLVAWKVNREEEFSGLKNADSVGKDCPATARKDVYRLHRSWIEANGGKFDKSEGVECEISPLVSYSGEALRELVEGRTLKSPYLLKAKDEC